MISWTCGLGVCGSATWFTLDIEYVFVKNSAVKSPDCQREVNETLSVLESSPLTCADRKAPWHEQAATSFLCRSPDQHLFTSTVDLISADECAAQLLLFLYNTRTGTLKYEWPHWRLCMCMCVCVVDDTNESIIMWNESTLHHKRLTHHTEEVINARLGGCGATNCFHYNYTSDKYQPPAASGRVVKLLMFDSDV